MITTFTNHRSAIDIETRPLPLPEAGIDIMLDIETLGTKPGSIILAVGAVRFDAAGIHDSFYTAIIPESCEEAGMRIDASTVCWWLKQSDAARKEAVAATTRIVDALYQFNGWIARNAPSGCAVRMWGNGAAFDNILLRSAYEACLLTPPWDHWNDRCYRTMKNLFPQVPKPERWGIHHKADDDAAYQACHLAAIFRFLKS